MIAFTRGETSDSRHPPKSEPERLLFESIDAEASGCS